MRLRNIVVHSFRDLGSAITASRARKRILASLESPLSAKERLDANFPRFKEEFSRAEWITIDIDTETFVYYGRRYKEILNDPPFAVVKTYRGKVVDLH